MEKARNKASSRRFIHRNHYIFKCLIPYSFSQCEPSMNTIEVIRNSPNCFDKLFLIMLVYRKTNFARSAHLTNNFIAASIRTIVYMTFSYFNINCVAKRYCPPPSVIINRDALFAAIFFIYTSISYIESYFK